MIDEKNINMVIENKYYLIKPPIPNENFFINNTEIKTENGGMWSFYYK